MELAPFTALLIGLFSTVHCVGMCGGIMGALTYSLPAELRSRRGRLLAYVASYNLGRLTSYTLAGGLFGVIGGSIYGLASPRWGYLLLQYTAAGVLIAIGLYLSGWFPRFAMVERIGVPLWRRLEPFGRRLIPVRSLPQAFAYGLIWGWLPCGLVYAALLLTITAGGPGEGALFMAGFGIGTLPALLGVGILAERVRHWTATPRIRQAAGAILVLLGSAGLLFADQLHLTAPLAKQESVCIDERL